MRRVNRDVCVKVVPSRKVISTLCEIPGAPWGLLDILSYPPYFLLRKLDAAVAAATAASACCVAATRSGDDTKADDIVEFSEIADIRCCYYRHVATGELRVATIYVPLAKSSRVYASRIVGDVPIAEHQNAGCEKYRRS